MNDKVRQLQKEIEVEKRRIANCKHNFCKAYYNPDTKMEPYGFKQVAHGSDVWTEAEGYREVTVDRWTRKCEKCGFEEHTNKQKPIIKGYEPDF